MRLVLALLRAVSFLSLLKYETSNMASSEEDVMLVVAMLLVEEEEENQSKRKRKQCWARSWMLERKAKGSFHLQLRRIHWRLRATCEWTSSILAKLLIFFRKDFIKRT